MPQIIFLNKFVLANFTQEFRWLLFVLKRLNNPFLLSKVLISSSYAIQFTRYSRHSRSRVIVPHPEPFVKNFFRLFQTFLSSVAFPPLLADSLHILAPHAPFVKHFFHFFDLFFAIPQSWVETGRIPQNNTAPAASRSSIGCQGSSTPTASTAPRIQRQ